MLNLSLVQRIHAAFILLLLLLLGGGMVTYSQSQHISDAVVRMTSDANVLAELARQNQIALLRTGKALADMGQSRDSEMLTAQAAAVAESLSQLQSLQQQLVAHAQRYGHNPVLNRSGEGQQLLASLHTASEQIQALLAKVLVESGAVASARSEFLLRLSIARQAIQRIAGAAAAEDQYVADMLNHFDESISLVEFIITNILAANDTAKMAEMLAKVIQIALTQLCGFIGQMMPRLRQQQNLRPVELPLQHLQIVLPVHGHVRLPLNDQRPSRTFFRVFDPDDPARQRAHPFGRQASWL